MRETKSDDLDQTVPPAPQRETQRHMELSHTPSLWLCFYTYMWCSVWLNHTTRNTRRHDHKLNYSKALLQVKMTFDPARSRHWFAKWQHMFLLPETHLWIVKAAWHCNCAKSAWVHGLATIYYATANKHISAVNPSYLLCLISTPLMLLKTLPFAKGWESVFSSL